MQWREQWAGKLSSPDEFAEFVNSVGCCTSLPVRGFHDFPNQDEALAPNAPGTWFWKDDLHIERHIYYTRVFGGQPGFLSFEMLPVLIATNGAVIDELRFNGLLQPEMGLIYEAVDTNGPIGTKELKRLLPSGAAQAASRVLIELDRKFLVTKTGLTGRTRGTYSYIWDTTERWIPDQLAAADKLGRKQAVATLHEHLSAFNIPPDSPFYPRVLGWEKERV